MKTYLGFKRVVTDKKTGLQTSETKFVPVDIPEINAEDNWKLIGSSDTVEVLPLLDCVKDVSRRFESVKISSEPVVGEQLTISGGDVTPSEKRDLPFGASFESSVSGTAKLIRANNDVFIAYRRGKKCLNQTSPNSVCISEYVKSKFFDDCRRVYGRSCDTYRFTTGSPEFCYWNKFIDEEYCRQLREFNNSK